jgi:hypothetical protein
VRSYLGVLTLVRQAYAGDVNDAVADAERQRQIAAHTRECSHD